jgi:hypothetical protein
MMSDYPGVVVGKANSTGMFTKAWEKAITSDNIDLTSQNYQTERCNSSS